MKDITQEEFCTVLREWKGQDLLMSTFSRDEDINQVPCRIGLVGLVNFSVENGSKPISPFRYDGAKISMSEDGMSLRIAYINSTDAVLLEKSYERGM